ncbi:MAG TPA: chemotaxis protein CheX [Candidatus Binatia bacterium]|nr:chemotaxis protein CheX [Candidatus Binatia bacterium]
MTSVEIVEESAREVVTTTVGTEVVRTVHATVPDTTFNGFVATLAFVGTKGGTLVVYCHRPLAVGMAADMLGMTGEEPDEETVRDALGELVNQIAGTIKRKMGESGNGIMLSVPVVVAGAPLSHCVKSSAQPLSVELYVPNGSMCVCLWPN